LFPIATWGQVDTVKSTIIKDGTLWHTNQPVFATARDSTDANGYDSNDILIGLNTGYMIYRGYLWFDLSGLSLTGRTIDSVVVKLHGDGDDSTDDFNITSRSVWYTENPSGVAAYPEWNDFDGWAASGAYGGTALTNDFNSADFSDETYNAIKFTSAGVDSVDAHKADTLKIILLSAEDVSSSEPANAEYVTFEAADVTGEEPKLVIYSSAAPAGTPTISPPTFQKIRTDKVTVLWDTTLNGATIDSSAVFISDLPGDTTGLVAWYPMNKGAGDSSLHSNDGTVDGATLVMGDTLLGGGAYSFDGDNDYIDLGFQQNGTKTILVWTEVKLDTDMHIITTMDGGTNEGWGILYKSTGNVIRSDWNGQYDVNSLESSGINLNERINIASVLDGADSKLYINGVLEDSKDLGSEVESLSNIRISGRWDGVNTGSALLFDGTIDEPKFFGRALTQSEILAYVNETRSARRSAGTTGLTVQTADTLSEGTKYQFSVFGFNADSLIAFSDGVYMKTKYIVNESLGRLLYRPDDYKPNDPKQWNQKMISSVKIR